MPHSRPGLPWRRCARSRRCRSWRSGTARERSCGAGNPSREAAKEIQGNDQDMSNGDLNWIANFIWGIADDALRDLYVRGKYRDVILPMIVLRRLDAVLEPTKATVLSMKDN